MRQFTKTIHIKSPPEKVWRVIEDVAHWHEWTASITKVTLVDSNALKVGGVVMIKQPKFPVAKWVVTDIKPNLRFTWVSTNPGIVVKATHAITPTADGSHVTLQLEFNGWLSGLFASLTAAINMRYMTMEAEGLRARCESIS
jgi:uncharacterized protein YndB with AHSA1/START domain